MNRSRQRSLSFAAALLAVGMYVSGCTKDDPAPSPSAGISDEQAIENLAKVYEDRDGLPGTFEAWAVDQIGARAWGDFEMSPYHSSDKTLPGSACFDVDVEPGTEEYDEIFQSYVIGNATYCSVDGNIWYDADTWDADKSRDGAVEKALVLLHELGHRFSDMAGFRGEFSFGEENQADCIAGLVARYAVSEGLMVESDFTIGVELMKDIAVDDPGGAWWMQGVHGSKADRKIAFFTGWDGTLVDCQKTGQETPGLEIKFGPFTGYYPDDADYESILDDKGFEYKRITMPALGASADVRVYVANPGTFEELANDWFGETLLGSLPVEDYGLERGPILELESETLIPINEVISPELTVLQAMYYGQRLEDGTEYLGVWFMITRQSGEILIMDIYADAASGLPATAAYLLLTALR